MENTFHTEKAYRIYGRQKYSKCEFLFVVFFLAEKSGCWCECTLAIQCEIEMDSTELGALEEKETGRFSEKWATVTATAAALSAMWTTKLMKTTWLSCMHIVVSAAEMLKMTNDNTKQSHAPFGCFTHSMRSNNDTQSKECAWWFSTKWNKIDSFYLLTEAHRNTHTHTHARQTHTERFTKKEFFLFSSFLWSS